jgi:hypothetical protein
MHESQIPTPLKNAFMDAMDAALKENHELVKKSVATILSYGEHAAIAALMSWALPLKLHVDNGVQLEHHIVLMGDEGMSMVDETDDIVPAEVKRAINMIKGTENDLQKAAEQAYAECMEDGGAGQVGVMMIVILDILGQAKRALSMTGVPVVCPTCFVHYQATSLDGTSEPNVGDVVICVNCGRPAAFDEELHLRKLTPAEQQEADESEEFQKAMEAIQEWRKRNPNPGLN